ncbi:MAG: 16S rRNA (uracil(1498)-N(3))-methyltransferase [Prevotella sp.]|nr:16S rRNA (uracil(1498)-N(3))-methyltransferase [Prevotella sp.]
MKEERFFYVPCAQECVELPEEEAAHAVRVLRLNSGDELMLMDGAGTFYRAVVTQVSGKHCFYDIQESLTQAPAWLGHLHLAVAPTKMMERMEWMVEKATEIGIDELSLLDCRFSERHIVKTQRLERIIVSAMKQSHKAWKPLVNEMTDFRSFLAAHSSGTSARYIAHCYHEIPRVNLFEELKTNSDPSVLVMIGPEGDFSIDEVRMALDAGFISVDLGKSRLRTETACIASVMMMQLSRQ